MVPFLYLVYANSGVSPSAQTVVAHATSLGVAFVTATVGTWRYARVGAIAWQPAASYAVPGIFTAFLTARVLTRLAEVHWVRAAFGVFLLVTAADMARRARRARRQPEPHPHNVHSWGWLVLAGLGGGILSAMLGIGGGLIAVPVLLYVGKLPVHAAAPTALAGVCLTTLSGAIGYVTAGTGPVISPFMAGYVDLRMALPLSFGAMVTVPLGVRMNRQSSAPGLYACFAAVFAGLGLYLLLQWSRGLG
jgi:uncharacterized membrane protein YfcA